MTTYDLAVDADQWDEVGGLWLDEGTYELDGIGAFVGPEGVKEMLTRPAHTHIRENHGGHRLGNPVILLEGDRAVATTYGQILTRQEGRHQIFRFFVTRWELRRTTAGWRVSRRINKRFDNDGDARDLAGRPVSGSGSPTVGRPLSPPDRRRCGSAPVPGTTTRCP